MTLYDGALGERYKIIYCDTGDDALRDRFMSFGIVKNKICQVVSHSLRRLAIAILIDGTQIALRESEAKMIIVEPLNTQENSR